MSGGYRHALGQQLAGDLRSVAHPGFCSH